MARILLDLVDIMDAFYEDEYSYRDACEVRPAPSAKPFTAEMMLAFSVALPAPLRREVEGRKVVETATGRVVFYNKVLDDAAWKRINAKVAAQREAARRGSR